MPGIIITPGNFNPPSTPLETPGVITYPKVPDVTLNRRPQQSSRSRVTGFTPRLLPVNYTIWNPLGIAGAGPRLGSVANFRVRGTRYVPDGSYLDNVQANLGNDVDYYGEVFNEQASPDYPEIPDVAGYGVSGQHGVSQTTIIKQAHSVTVILDGCDDGANYEVYAFSRLSDIDLIPPRRLLENLGGGRWRSEFTQLWGLENTGLSYPNNPDPGYYVPPHILNPPYYVPNNILRIFGLWETFELTRNGDIYDVIQINMGFRCRINFTMVDTFPPEVDTESSPGARNLTAPAAPAVSVILYGPNADVTTVPSPDPINITRWQRESYATQGYLLFS